jgi:hypothetical protein
MTLYKGAVLNLEGQDSGLQRKFRVVLLSSPDTTFNEKTFREVQLVGDQLFRVKKENEDAVLEKFEVVSFDYREFDQIVVQLKKIQ